jgi:hypothetical protein
MAKSVVPSLHIFTSPEFKGVVASGVRFLAKTPVHPLPPKGTFEGVGTYLLYYAGSFELYSKFANDDATALKTPIYAGKAVPQGWRTARTSRVQRSRELCRRLYEHAASIRQCKNLSLRDFFCRFIILKGSEIDLVAAIEAQLIRRYMPLWNTVIDGFGNHDPGSGRYNQAKSEWDMLHPGRHWARKLTGKPPDLGSIKVKIQARH